MKPLAKPLYLLSLAMPVLAGGQHQWRMQKAEIGQGALKKYFVELLRQRQLEQDE